MSDPNGYVPLRDKYRLMLQMREVQEVDPRARMASLARRFPGALRELDQLPLARIRERLARLQAVVDGELAPPCWARLQRAYHGWMRLALAIKGLDVGLEAGALRAALALVYTPGPGEPPISSLEPLDVAEIRQPAGGRLNPWVLLRVARQCGVQPRQVDRALWGSGPECA